MRVCILSLLLLSGCTGEDLLCDAEDAPLLQAAGRDALLFPAEDARAIAVLFHGLGESSCTWTDRVEGARISARLQGAGYTVLAPDAGPDKAYWGTRWPSNDDVDAIDAMVAELDALGLIDASLPAVTLGHSNGATFAPIYAEAGALDSVAAVVANGWGSEALSAKGSPPPLLFIAAENDLVVPSPMTTQAEQRARDAGHTTEFERDAPQPLDRDRFARIPGLDEDDSRALFAALHDADLLDEDDLLTANPRLDRAWSNAIPAALDEHRDAIEEQLHVLYAEHRFSSDNGDRIQSFFDDALER